MNGDFIEYLDLLTEAGTPERQAKAQLSILSKVKSGLATKADLENLEKNIEIKIDSKISQRITEQTWRIVGWVSGIVGIIGTILAGGATAIIVAYMPTTYDNKKGGQKTAQQIEKPTLLKNANAGLPPQVTPKKNDRDKGLKKAKD